MYIQYLLAIKSEVLDLSEKLPGEAIVESLLRSL